MSEFVVILLLVLVNILSVVKYSDQRSTPDSSDYTAAVVEFDSSTLSTNITTFQRNSDRYVELIKTAGNFVPDTADIIVFPQFGLESIFSVYDGQLPRPADKIAPCDDSSSLYDHIKDISCAARDNHIYVVINLSEISPCPDGHVDEYNVTCPSTEVLHYNANLVFDRNGVVIQKYRLFNEFKGNERLGTPVAELATFDTDFGVTFGTFTSLDLLFEKPAVELVKTTGITNIVYPTAWTAELPFMAGEQSQAQWAYALNVNLLSASYSYPAKGMGGSGIIAGQLGPRAYFTSSETTTKLIVSSLWKKPLVGKETVQETNKSVSSLLNVANPKSGRQTDNDHASKPIRSKQNDLQDSSKLMYLPTAKLDDFASHLLTPELSGQEIVVCHDAFCCKFTVDGDQTDDGSKSYYHLLAFEGLRAPLGHSSPTVGVQTCAVVSCKEKEIQMCSLDQNDSPTTFITISIEATFRKKNAMQSPSTLVHDVMDVISVYVFSFDCVDNSESSELSDCQMNLNVATSEIHTFGIFGRDFTRDGDALATGTARKAVLGMVLTVIVAVSVAVSTIF